MSVVSNNMNDDKIYPSMVIRSQAEAIELLEKENKRLENNWNNLEQWLKECIIDIELLEDNDSYDIYEQTTLKNVLNKMRKMGEKKDEQSG